MSSVPSSFTSREDARKAKELEEARKAGTAEPEKDEEGNAINPHIPQYISKAPWYLNQQKPGLKHQRFVPGEKEDIRLWYERGRKREGAAAKKTKFEKGACANCGAKTHSEKECVERPRSKKAKFTQSNLCADEEVFEDLKLSYDGKRDRYAGYDPSEYKWVIRAYELAEIERKRRKALELEKQILTVKRGSKRRRRAGKEGDAHAQNTVQQKDEKKEKEKEKEEKERREKKKEKTGEENAEAEAEGSDSGEEKDSGSSDSGTSDSDSDSGDSSDEDVKQHDFDQTSAPVACSDDRFRINTKNLRIREDTAKYLLNLDINSAFYDPKSRSMRGNPFEHLKEEEQALFKGDNCARKTGDVLKAQQLQLFAWEAYKHGAQVHFNAQPTQLEKLYQEHVDRKKELEEEKKNALLNKYGGKEHLNADPRMLLAQTEVYVEYSRDGNIAKGRNRVLIKSKYEEDAYVGNHTSVFGSWYNLATQKWGFKCCRQTDFAADCTGRQEDAITEESIGLTKAASSSSDRAAVGDEKNLGEGESTEKGGKEVSPAH
ncbi:SLU7 splicing factor, putative [Toxoplasma gondii ME49]|uniref:Pre-mRNA-splicing factor SLU7 n=2 Tax=Toxoplasma gondii TaxID=5811 RepID=B6KAF0_TOXGV|nr:SLU7 splicing factor, putative [Toxoplasma gondii ME49]EPT26147.1 SLU7 splicing factor, putative [Toxoplasma gondii ME49]ESS34943.1 putative SLU7 splicing factor [Toxoplasma gondii VEG]CEL77379.1 TPA: step II splicing factor SLU7, putative [Toxoplasma gondii VEG]|eukprot:XP_002364328.1 SLU7 splicing factor, putative [Toxoplasma gondii ME49]